FIGLEADHRPKRLRGTAGFDVLTCLDGGWLQMQHRNAVDDREDATLASEDSVVNLIRDRPMEHRADQFEPCPAKRAPQNIEQFDVHRRSSTGSATVSRFAR